MRSDRLSSTLFASFRGTRFRAQRHSCSSEHRDDVFRALGRVTTIVELGPGRGEKLLALLEARPPQAEILTIHLVDISRAALTASARALGGLEDIEIVTHEAPYEVGLEELGR